MSIWSPSPGGLSVSFVHRRIEDSLGYAFVGIWTEGDLNPHSNILEMKAVQMALIAFRDWIMVESIVLMSDNAAVMTYIKKHGGIIS